MGFWKCLRLFKQIVTNCQDATYAVFCTLCKNGKSFYEMVYFEEGRVGSGARHVDERSENPHTQHFNSILIGTFWNNELIKGSGTQKQRPIEL